MPRRLQRRPSRRSWRLQQRSWKLLEDLTTDVRRRFDPARSRNEGLWSWLALFYFDSLCPQDADGKRRVRAVAHYRYVGDYAPFRSQRAYRHLLAMPYRIIRRHGAALSKGLLGGPAHGYSDHFEQVASRQDLWNDPGFLRIWHEIYFDQSLTKWDPRAGTAGRKGPGSSRRLTDIFRQFARTYDVRDMDPVELHRLLPAEFKFKKSLP